VSIYHEYDIRGVYPSEINEKNAYLIGKAFVQLYKSKRIAIGADMRTSSPALKRALIRGVTEMGCHVVDIGLCSTPMLYYVSRYYDAIMITASHNPAQYNGLKMCRKGCKVIGRNSGLVKIKKIVKRGVYTKLSKRKGKTKRIDYKKEYVDFLLSFKLKKQKKLKIVVDAGNGMAGLFAPRVLRHFPVKLVPMYFSLDGRFPNHVPNPIIPKNVKMLIKRVKQKKADLGIAFDADVDRVRFIDNTGKAINADISLALFADYFLKKGAKRIVKDITCSKIVDITLKGRGKLIVSRVGHTNLTNALRTNKAIFGGERSGHYYFKKNKYCDNAMIAMIVMLNILSQSKESLSTLLKPYMKFSSMQVNLKVKNKEKVLIKIKQKYNKQKKSLVDGVSVYFKNWWFNARASNTEPLLRLTVEAKTKEVLNKKIKVLKKLIN